MEKAKQKGQQELLGRRERLRAVLEKLGLKIEELADFSELDMMHQVQSDDEL